MELIPQHIAIIMDGNGRWAQSRGLPRIEGHRRGVKALKEIVRSANSKSVKILTCYAFSKENWNRPPEEVSFLMKLLGFFARNERRDMLNENIRFSTIGSISHLPEEARFELEKSQEVTAGNTGLHFQLALNYSGRDEILRAVMKMRDVGALSKSEISEDEFESFLDTAGQPDPDLVIRTSGEMRVSNFLIWQTAYSEFFFSERYWPDFDVIEFERALESYAKRERRFGGLLTKDASASVRKF